MEEKENLTNLIIDIIDDTLSRAAVELECQRPDVAMGLIKVARDFIRDYTEERKPALSLDKTER